MKRALILGAVVIGLAVGGLIIAFRPGTGQAEEPTTTACPHGADIKAMREQMDGGARGGVL